MMLHFPQERFPILILFTYPEHRPTEIEIGAVRDAVRAAERTDERANRRGPEDAAEHPRRGRDITDTATTWGITFHLAPAILTTATAAECVSGFYCITLTTVVFFCTSRAVATCDSFDYSTTGIFYSPSTSR